MRPLRCNPKNDRARRDFLIYLKDARQRSPATVEQARHAIDRLEAYTGFKDFASFNKDQALGFKSALLASKAKRSGKQISKATAYHVLQAVRDFLAWLHSRPGYRRRIDPTHIAYLNLTAKDERIAHTTAPKSYASLEQYRRALFAMPTATDVERRDRALMALLLLTGMRGGRPQAQAYLDRARLCLSGPARREDQIQQSHRDLFLSGRQRCSRNHQ